MIDCPSGDIRDLLPDLLHGRLDAAERERVEAHVAGCEPCRDELALLRDLRTTMRRAPAMDATAIAAAIAPYRAPVRRSWATWRAAAAIATIAIGGTSIAIVNRQPNAPTAATVAQNPVEPAVRPAPSAREAPAPATEVPAVAAKDSAPTDDASAPNVQQSTRELAMGSGTVGDLSDRELTALLNDIETLDALPSADVETALPVTPLEPAGGSR